MDIDSLSKAPARLLICGVFIIIAAASLVVLFPLENRKKDVSPIFKGPRPYKQNVTDLSSNNALLTIRPNKKELLFHPIIHDAANRYGVDPDLIKAIILAESRYDPGAISKKGAVGLMQIMPATATDLGATDLLDPERNVDAGVKYFKKLLNQFNGNLSYAIAAYNAGYTKVKRYRGIPPYKSTRYYVKKVFEYYQGYMRNSKHQGKSI